MRVALRFERLWTRNRGPCHCELSAGGESGLQEAKQSTGSVLAHGVMCGCVPCTETESLVQGIAPTFVGIFDFAARVLAPGQCTRLPPSPGFGVASAMTLWLCVRWGVEWSTDGRPPTLLGKEPFLIRGLPPPESSVSKSLSGSGSIRFRWFCLGRSRSQSNAHAHASCPIWWTAVRSR